MIALDTNLLVFAHRRASPEHSNARRAIEHAANTGAWGVTVFSVAEFWAAVTHPAASPPSAPDATAQFVMGLEQSGALIWLPGVDFRRELLFWGSHLNVSGRRIYDLQIAITARENGADEIWTHDRHFVAIPGLTVRDPL